MEGFPGSKKCEKGRRASGNALIDVSQLRTFFFFFFYPIYLRACSGALKLSVRTSVGLIQSSSRPKRSDRLVLNELQNLSMDGFYVVSKHRLIDKVVLE